MSERITAGTISGCAERTIEVHSAVEMFAGGYERKKYLEGTLGTKHISLVERSGSPEKLQYYARHWQAFRDIGLPVVPTLRTSSSGSLLATDL
ncbi:hypothetical protein HYS00_01240, partial [Candidatus Microgenomates bacterium]|nr:hypothetical protein [Candidatus Microgenomates bacterium]